MTPSCRRCAEPLVLAPPNGLCVWCSEEIELGAIGALVSHAGDGSNDARAKRAGAIDDLLRLGYSKQQVLFARARALDGKTVEEIRELLLGGAERVGAVA